MENAISGAEGIQKLSAGSFDCALVDMDELTRSLAAGADDVVGKSNDTAILRARIQALLRRRSFQQANRRLAAQVKEKELETVRARAEREAPWQTISRHSASSRTTSATSWDPDRLGNLPDSPSRRVSSGVYYLAQCEDTSCVHRFGNEKRIPPAWLVTFRRARAVIAFAA